MRIVYNGDLPQWELWGVTFPKGEVVEVESPDLAEKALRLVGFEKARGRPKKVKADGEDQT